MSREAFMILKVFGMTPNLLASTNPDHLFKKKTGAQKHMAGRMIST